MILNTDDPMTYDAHEVARVRRMAESILISAENQLRPETACLTLRQQHGASLFDRTAAAELAAAVDAIAFRRGAARLGADR